MLTVYGEGGRQAYTINLPVDSVMPVFFAVVTLLVVARAAPRWQGLLSPAPIVFMVFDLIENVSFGIMLAKYPKVAPGLVAATSPITMIKLSAFVVAYPTLVLGVIAILIGWVLKRRAVS